MCGIVGIVEHDLSRPVAPEDLARMVRMLHHRGPDEEGTITMPVVSLAAGDIDNNNVIDQFDALTIGMNYNSPLPTAADLNNDGIINLLDLELLAINYRKSGPIIWQ